MIEFTRDTPFPWTCPHCAIRTTVTNADLARQGFSLNTNLRHKEGDKRSLYVDAVLVRCPNPECHEDFVAVSTHEGTLVWNEWAADRSKPLGSGYFIVHPSIGAPLSSAVPENIRKDFAEAWLIRKLSPKASATLSRRALQGILRDFWNAQGRTLHDELKSIEGNCDPELYKAMMALKAIGNIGAHPDKDVNTILDIDPAEAEELLGLLRILDSEWYVARENRQKQLAKMAQLGQKGKV